MGKWFLSENDEVRGPFTDAQIQAQLDAQILSTDCLVWTKGMDIWRPVSLWESELRNQPMTPIEAQQKRLWHYAFDGQAHGPIPYSSLVGELKKLGDRANEVQLWTKGMAAWAPLFDFHEVMDELEINRRQTPRGPIEGNVVIQLGQQQMIGALRSISQGGFGADRVTGLLPGQLVNVELRSKSLFENFNVKAEVRYITENGYAGFIFTQINREAVNAIVQHLKQSQQPNAAAA